MIDDRAQTTLTELENIKKNTERELAALSEKYKVLDSVGDSFSIIAMLFVGGVYVWTVVLDILKIVMKKKEDEKKPAAKKSTKRKKNTNKKNNNRKESKVDDDDNDDDKEDGDDDEEKKNQPRTSRSRGNSIITNGKRYSIELLENVARRVSFDTKMFNSLLKPLAQSQKELLSKVRAPSNLGNSAQAEPNFTHMSREVSQVSQVGPLVSRQKSTAPESRRKSIEMNVMSRLRKLSNVMAAYRHPHEDFAKEKEYTQTLSDYFGTDYDPKMKKKKEDDEENENADKSTKLASNNPNVRQRSGGIAANKSLNEKVEEEEEKKEEEEEEEDGFHYDTSNSILNSWYGKQPQRLKSESGSRTEIISVASSKPEIGEEEEEEVETAANKAAKVKVENELDPKQSKSLNKKATNNSSKKSKIRLEANANGGDFRRYVKRVSYANTKLSKPNTMVIIDDKS